MIMANRSPESVEDFTDRSDVGSNEDADSEDLLSSISEEKCGTKVKESKISPSMRLMRNMAEKQRRDRMNTCISKLASLVPIVAMATKRIDKSSILRLSASYLRIHYSLLQTMVKNSGWRPSFISSSELDCLLMESMNGFLLITSEIGKVIYVSEGIEQILGHCVLDVLGQSVYTFVHPDDWSIFRTNLQHPVSSKDRDSGLESQNESVYSFFCCMSVSGQMRGSTNNNYELVQVTGRAREVQRVSNVLLDCKNEAEDDGQTPEKLLVSIVRLAKLHPVTPLSTAIGQNEFISQHSLDGRFLYADHRMSLIAGHLPSEVLGSSAYEFVCGDDVALASLAHRQLLGKDGTCRVTYRLVTRTKSIVFICTSGVLIKASTDDLNTLVCRNRVLNAEDGEKALESLKTHFSPLVITKQENGTGDGTAVNEDKKTCSASEADQNVGNNLLNGNGTVLNGCNTVLVKVKRKRGRPRKHRPLNEWVEVPLLNSTHKLDVSDITNFQLATDVTETKVSTSDTDFPEIPLNRNLRTVEKIEKQYDSSSSRDFLSFNGPSNGCHFKPRKRRHRHVDVWSPKR